VRRPFAVAMCAVTLATSTIVAFLPRFVAARDTSGQSFVLKKLICIVNPTNYAVSTTPDGSPVTVVAYSSGNTSTFTVKNTGLCQDTYALTGSRSGQVSAVTLNKSTANLLPGATTTVVATYSVGIPGTGVLTLTARGGLGGESDNGTFNVTVAATHAVAVTPDGSTTPNRVAYTSGYTASFTVKNTGLNADTFAISCTAAAPAACSGISASSVPLAVGAQATVTATYNVGAPGTGSVSLMASANGATDDGFFNVPVIANGVSVTPDGATATARTPNSNGYTESFTVTNTGSVANAYTITCIGSPNVTCTGTNPSTTPTINPGQSTGATASYNVGAAGTGLLTLKASGSNAVDSGTYNIPIGTVSALPPVVDLSSINPGSLSERSVCLTIAMGAAAAAECGDLRFIHPLPSTKTLNKARTPILLYNSQTAHPYPLIAANVTLQALSLVPDSTVAILTINSVVRARGKWTGSEWSPGKTRRIVLGFDGLADATGIYSYTLEFRNWFGINSQPTTQTGQFPIVNRSGSAFGAGWWMAGLEKLDVGTMIWVGGDGSVRQYLPVTTNVWAAANLDHPDTLRKDGSGNYTRYDRDSVRVTFDAMGYHIRTTNRQGHVTTFAYTSGHLDSISVPVRLGTPKRYRFTYDGNSKLQTVSAPGPTGAARTTAITVTSGRLVTIRDPDNTLVSFGYDAGFTNRVTSRTDRRNAVTTYSFDGGNKVSQSSLNMGAGKPPIVKTLTSLESRGLPGSGTPSSVDTLLAYTKFDGPRPDVGDTTRFWLDRFGAPRKIVDAVGGMTLLARTNSHWPLLVTRVQYPSGQILGAVYDSLRGLLLSSTDSSIGATTSYVWDPKWDAVRKNTRPLGDSISFSIDAATGNVQWQQDGRGPVSRVTFAYNTANQVTTVTPPNTSIQKIGYDSLGNLDSVTSSRGFLTTYLNDAVGRATQISSPLDTVVPATLRQVQLSYYDIADRDTLTISAGPAIAGVVAETVFVRKRYNANGQLDTLTRRASPDTTRIGTITTRWVHDTAGRVVAEIAPDGKVDSNYYDLASNDTLMITRRSFKIAMAYDVLNRLGTRIVPAVQYPTRASGLSNVFLGPNNYPAFLIPADTQTFTYDQAGRVLTARNGDARVRRTYYTNGLLRTDSLWIRTVQGWDSTKHAYGTRNLYDLDNRRYQLDIPAQLGMSGLSTVYTNYDPQFGALKSIADLDYAVYNFTYTPRSELATITYPGQYTQSYTYDADGRVTIDSIRNLGGTNYPRLGINPLRAIGYSYDARGKLLHGADPYAYLDTLNMSYSGLGYLVQSTLTQHGVVPNCGNTFQYSAAETFRYDGLGNRTHTATSTSASSGGGCSTISTSLHGSAYEVGTGRLTKDTLNSGVTFYTNDPAGEVEFLQNLGSPAQERASYYGADGRLRAIDSRQALGPSDHFGDASRTFEEYRYDALGRRIWVRSRKKCNYTGTDPWQGTECVTSLLRRVIWDGDQILAEIQMPGDSTSRDIPYWENDTAAVFLAVINAGGGNGDPSRYFGRVAYAPGLGIDHPISVTRYNYVRAVANDGFVEPQAVLVQRATVMPFWNALGDAPLGAYTNGARVLCTPPTSTTECEGVVWPYLFSAYDRERGITHDNWQGSLLEGGQDKSGLQFMRNRFYDPQTGRFTQEDPIGLGGGLNLYGFAAGDPVNFSDPFGLCPPDNPDSYADCEAGTSGWYAYRLATGEGNRFLNNVGGVLTSCNESVLCQGVLLVASLGSSAAEAGAARGATSISEAARLGRAGEEVAGVAGKAKSAIPSLLGTAARRIPDALDWAARTLTEVKNVRSLGFTNQIADELVFAKANGLQFILKIDGATQLSPFLQKLERLGEIVVERLPMR
jgi:RHS repeat-associated protein